MFISEVASWYGTLLEDTIVELSEFNLKYGWRRYGTSLFLDIVLSVMKLKVLLIMKDHYPLSTFYI